MLLSFIIRMSTPPMAWHCSMQSTEIRTLYKILVIQPDEIKLGVDGRILLKWIIKKYNFIAWTGFNWLRIASGRI